MKLTKWKRYKNIYTPLTHYTNIDNTNWNVKVQGKKLKNGDNAYSITVSDGRNYSKIGPVVIGFKQAKKEAENLLISQYKDLIENKKELNKLSYDLTEVNLKDLTDLFFKYDIATRGQLVYSKKFMFKGEKVIHREDLEKANVFANANELGISAIYWEFNSYCDKYKTKIHFGANPFAKGLLACTTQGTRGDGYCSYIEIESENEDFIRDFKGLVKKGYTK